MKAKSLLEQNRHKVGDLVGKATEQVDKVSKGKTTNVSAKVEEAARKYSAGSVSHHGEHPDASPGAAPGMSTTSDAPVDDAELQRRQAAANIAAANALKSAADAAANIFNKAASQPSSGPTSDPSSAKPNPPTTGTGEQPTSGG